MLRRQARGHWSMASALPLLLGLTVVQRKEAECDMAAMVPPSAAHEPSSSDKGVAAIISTTVLASTHTRALLQCLTYTINSTPTIRSLLKQAKKALKKLKKWFGMLKRMLWCTAVMTPAALGAPFALMLGREEVVHPMRTPRFFLVSLLMSPLLPAPREHSLDRSHNHSHLSHSHSH